MINHLNLVWLLSFDGLFSSVTGEGNSPSSSAGKIYGQNPEILNPAFDPYGLFYNNGWFHFGRQAPAPAPASQTVQCGKGPIDFTIPAPPGAPPARSLLPSNRALGATAVSSVANPWPFLVSWFNSNRIDNRMAQVAKCTLNIDRALINLSYY